MIRSTLLAATAALATFAAVGSASAASPLAQYFQLPGNPAPTLSFDGSTLSTGAAGDVVQFSFLNPSLPGGNIDATFHFTATTSGPADFATIGGVQYDAEPMAGSFSFVSTSGFSFGGHSYGAGTTLLAGTFADSELSGVDFGSTASDTDSRLVGGTVNFTSGISGVTFGSGDEGISIALNSVAPYFGLNGSTYAPFTAISAGNFSADVTISGGGGGVPEAGTWALMILGCGIAGAQIRARRASLAKI